jgi:hypothetical protein
MENLIVAGIGCIAGLALWKATKERWFFALIGWSVIAVAIRSLPALNDLWSSVLVLIVACAVLAVCGYGLNWYDKRVTQVSKSTLNEPIPGEEHEAEICELRLYDTTDKQSTEVWDVFPNRKTLVHYCDWGLTEIYEYAVRHTTVFVRLIERSTEGPGGHKYEVFNGCINAARLEEDYAMKVQKYRADVNVDFRIDETPSFPFEQLEKRIVWHEIYGAIRYFVLAKQLPLHEATFFREEFERFTKAFAAIAQRADQLGAVWNELSSRYETPESTTSDAKKRLEEELSIFKFGFHHPHEFLQKDLILRVLSEASN